MGLIIIKKIRDVKAFFKFNINFALIFSQKIVLTKDPVLQWQRIIYKKVRM
jgi:hypothetical protein